MQRERAANILRPVRWVVSMLVGWCLDTHLLVKLIVWNVAGLLLLSGVLGFSRETIEEFTPAGVVAAVVAGLAESDAIRFVRRQPDRGPAAFYGVMVPVLAFAVAVGGWSHRDRVRAEAAAAERRRANDLFQAQMASPNVRRGADFLARVTAAGASAAAAVTPGRATTAPGVGRGHRR